MGWDSGAVVVDGKGRREVGWLWEEMRDVMRIAVGKPFFLVC